MDIAQQGAGGSSPKACSSKFDGAALVGDPDVDGERCSSRDGETPPHEQQQHASAHHYQQHRRRHHQSTQPQQQQQQQQPGGFIRGADRRTLQNVRVIRRTLVYAIGLSPNFSQVNTLKQPEYFGQYGEITKLVINHHHGVAPDDPRHGSASAYITFRRSEDAWAAICSVDGFRIMGRTIRASFGTTKYCNSFLRNLPCNNPDCLYLHELGDQDDRFTKDEVQVGLARHGSSFAFKEEVLGNRKDGDQNGDAARPQPASPVFPPPCAMPPASYQRDGTRHKKEGGSHHHHHNHPNNHASGAYGHAPPPGTSSHTFASCAIHGGGNRGAPPGACARWMAGPTGPGSPMPLGGSGDDRPRLRRRRGQRGRRGSGTGDPSGGVPSEYEETLRCGPGGVHEQHGGCGGVFHLPDRALPSVPSLDHCYDMGGGGLSNGNLYRPVPKPTPGFGGSDRSIGSGSSWGKGCGSPSVTAETLSSTPPLELSQLEGFSPTSTSNSFFGAGSVGIGTAPPPPREIWNQGQDHRHSRPSPTSFSGVVEAETQRGFVEQHKRLQQQHLLEQQQLLQLLQLQRQQQQLFQTSFGGVRPQNLLEASAPRHHQQQFEGGVDERATIAVLQQQVQQFQRYFEKNEGGGAGRTPAALPPPAGSGYADSSAAPATAPALGGASSFSDDLSFAEEHLAALSWGDGPTGNSHTRMSSQQLGGGGGAEVADLASRRGVRDESASSSLWAASSPIVGFGSLAQASAASQAEASEWRRATPRLFA